MGARGASAVRALCALWAMSALALRCRGADDHTDADLRSQVRALQVQVAALHELRATEQALRRQVEALSVEVESLRGGGQRNQRTAWSWAAAAVRGLRAEAAAAAAAHNASAAAAARRAAATSAALRLLRSDVEALRDEAAAARAQAVRDTAAAHALRTDVAQAQHDARAAAQQSSRNKEKLTEILSDWAADAHRQLLLRAEEQPSEEVEDWSRNNEVPGSAPLKLHHRRHHHCHQAAQAMAQAAQTAQAAQAMRAGALRLLEGQQALQARVDEALPALQSGVAAAQEAAQAAQAMAQAAQNEARAARQLQEDESISARALAQSVSALQERRSALKAADAGSVDSQGLLQLQVRVDAVERQLRHVQAVSTTSTAVPANASHRAVPSLLRQLTRLREDYDRVVAHLPRDCGAVDGPSGLYLLAPGGAAPLVAACDQHTQGGGWTVVQRRVDGRENFNRSWMEYTEGFGAPTGEVWLGNDALHRLTADNCSALRVELRDIYGRAWTAEYAHFAVSSAADGFRLRVAGYSGNASDALDYQNNMQFSASDRDRDISNTHCAANYEGGWWFSHCQHANLNGRYSLGLTWFDSAKNEWIAVARSELKVRRRVGCT